MKNMKNMKYKILRLCGSKKVILCSQNYEDIEYFKIILKSEDYIILKDNEDVTEYYKKLNK